VPTTVEIEVVNTADVIDGVTAIVDGINPDWVRLERPVVSLFPETSERLSIVFDLPRDCPAGDYLIVVRVLSTIADDRQAIHDFWLTVGVVSGVDLSLRPSIVTGGSHATIDATITNSGNAAAAIEVTALEPTRAVDCRVDPSRFVLGPGAPAVLPIQLRGPRPWIGQPAARQIHIAATVDDVVVERIATFNQKPRIPRGLLTALMLAGIVLLWAFIFLYAINALHRNEPVAKATGTFFMEGPDNIPLGEIGGTIEGRVTAKTTGLGIPRITVEAVRVTDDAPQAMAVAASVATGDDGSYRIPSLIPGKYRLRLSGDGYSAQWYVDPDSDDQTVAVEPATATTGRDVIIAGGDGTIVGEVALPNGSAPLALTVRAIMAQQRATDAKPPEFEQDPPPKQNARGTYDIALTGLPTPATYIVTISGSGFETQQFEQEVGGGQDSIINTVYLDAQDGALEGTVFGDDGPLGDVDVVARSGTTEVRTRTSTVGDERGHYRLVGLRTPATYVVTFEHDGFGSQTKALDLPAGETPQPLDATLVSGSGTISGRAVSSADPSIPLGGLTVEVTGDTFHGETSTLTTNSANAAAGSFTMSGLAVPGTYTVTISGEDVQSETVGVTFDSDVPKSVGDVLMLPVNSQVRGTVSVGGGGLGEVEVVLTDGDRSQVTTTATNPAGAYAFTDVAEGSYTLTFRRDDLVRQIVLITVTAGVDTVRDVDMVVKGP
jgi:hypothetical protein